MPEERLSDDALLSTEELSAAFTKLNLPLSIATLITKRCRGEGPPYEKYGNKMVRYRWGKARDWRLAQGVERTSTSDAA
jgi:hypothetical protein